MLRTSRQRWTVVAALALLGACDDEVANDEGTETAANTSSGSDDGPTGDGDPGDGDGDGDPGDGDPGDGDPGDGDGDPNPVCGDGVVEGSEDCDDGNLDPGDGCSINCTESGSAVWEIFIDSPEHGPDRIDKADVDLAGNIVAVGYKYNTRWYAKIDGTNGNILWQGEFPGLASSIDVGTHTGDYVAISWTLNSVGYMRLLDQNGAMVWEEVFAQEVEPFCVDLLDDDSPVVGLRDAGVGRPGRVRRYDLQANELWTSPTLGDQGIRELVRRPDNNILAVAVNPYSFAGVSSTGQLLWSEPYDFSVIDVATWTNNNSFVAIGSVGGQITTAGYDATGHEQWRHTYMMADGAGQGVAVSGGVVISGGGVQEQIAGTDALLTWLTTGGAEQHQILISSGFNYTVEQIYGLQTTPDGHGVLYGAHYRLGQDQDMWMRKFEL